MIMWLDRGRGANDSQRSRHPKMEEQIATIEVKKEIFTTTGNPFEGLTKEPRRYLYWPAQPMFANVDGIQGTAD